MKGQQLPLSVQLRDTASFDSFYVGPNALTFSALRDLRGAVLVYGASGSGRTHLLQAVARTRGCAYLPLRELRDIGVDVLNGHDTAEVLCVDDLDAVCAERNWALTLLRLLDARRDRATLLSANAAPDRLELALPDLRTRLSQCTVFGLKPLTDADRAELLRERARARGLDLPPEVSRWLLTQLSRDTASLVDAVDALDRAALSAKRRLTLPFVQSILDSSSPQ